MTDLHHVVAAVHRRVDHRRLRLGLDADRLGGDEAVEPRGVDRVVLELGRLEELAEVLDRRADVAHDEELLERDHEVLARLGRGKGAGRQGYGSREDAITRFLRASSRVAPYAKMWPNCESANLRGGGGSGASMCVK